MTRFSLLSLLLVITLVAVGLGWWVEHTRKPEVYYLHVFARHAVRDEKNYKYKPKNQDRIGPLRIATVAIAKNTPFWLELPNDLVPTIHVEGEIRPRLGKLRGRLDFHVEAADIPRFESTHSSPIDLDKPNWLKGDQFYFVISRSKY